MKLSKKAIAIVLTALNSVFIIGNFFVSPLLHNKTRLIALADDIANKAAANAFKSHILSFDIIDATEKAKYMSFKQVTHTLKHHSTLVSPNRENKKNSIKVDNLIVETAVLLNDRIYSVNASDGTFKMYGDDLWYFSEPITSSKHNSKKSIILSESVAQKLLMNFDVEDYSDLGGEELFFEYANQNGNVTGENMFIRGVFIDEQGSMPLYRELYGEDIVLFYDTYFELDNVEAHVFLTNSSYKNQFTIELLNNLMVNDFLFRDAVLSTSVANDIQETYLRTKNKVHLLENVNPVLIVVGMLFAILLLIINIALLTKFYNLGVFAFYYMFLFMLNGIFIGATKLLSTLKVQNVFVSPVTGPIFVIYALLTAAGVILWRFMGRKNDEIHQ